VNVEIKGKKGKPSIFVTEDEEYKKVNYDKFASLPTGKKRGHTSAKPRTG
jgi:hypothetical protein